MKHVYTVEEATNTTVPVSSHKELYVLTKKEAIQLIKKLAESLEYSR